MSITIDSSGSKPSTTGTAARRSSGLRAVSRVTGPEGPEEVEGTEEVVMPHALPVRAVAAGRRTPTVHTRAAGDRCG